MNGGTLFALLLIIDVVSVEGGFGRSLKKRLKSIGRPFERGAKKAAEIAAASVAGKYTLSGTEKDHYEIPAKAIMAAASSIGRRIRSADEGTYKNLEERSLTGWKQGSEKY